MSDIYAFITGIERYEQDPKKWSMAGPARSAVDMAKWALSLEGDPAHLYLFVAVAHDKHEEKALAALTTDLDALKARGVNVVEKATRQVLYEFWRNTLLEFGAGRLFAYWCGHGGVNIKGDRVFFCEDYTLAKMANVIDWAGCSRACARRRPRASANRLRLRMFVGFYVANAASPDEGLQLKPREMDPDRLLCDAGRRVRRREGARR